MYTTLWVDIHYRNGYNRVATADTATHVHDDTVSVQIALDFGTQFDICKL